MLKRKGCQSCKVTISASKQARRSDLNQQAAPAIPEASHSAVAQQASLTLEEVEMVVEDIRDAGSFQAFLDVRGKDIHSEHILNTALFYNWKANGSQTPIKRAKTTPMLERTKIPFTMLLQLTSTNLMDIRCFFCRMLYDCSIQGQGVSHYVPQSYRSVALTAELAMEKIRQYISSAIHFCILRNPEFFMVNRLMTLKQMVRMMMRLKTFLILARRNRLFGKHISRIV